MGKKTKKLTSVLVSVSTIAWLSGATALMPVVASAQTDTSALIQQLQAQIAALQAQLLALAGGSSVPSAGKCNFTRDLTMGSRGDDVTCLQNYLTSTGHFTYSGGATGYFGSVTKSAASAWQAANGVSPAAGYFGSISRAKYNAMVVAMPAPAPAPAPVPGPGGTPAPVPAPSGTLKVETGVHPSASLFPVNATRVPFTVLKFTAPADKDVTVKSVVVERTGLASDTAFSGVLLLDEQGTQVGIARTLNSAHQATLNEAFVVKAGTTRVMTLAGNAQTSSNSLGGQVAYLSLVSVNSDLPVTGTLPIAGVGHTVNETLTIGSVTMNRGGTDPGASATKRVDTRDYVFSAVRVTAGSAEKVYLKSIRWNQTGSVGTSDLANVKTHVGGVAYDTVVSSDGKYYTSVFGDNGGKGILIDKGFSKDLEIKGDIIGGTLRTINFDLAKRTDIGLVGENFGFGITPPQTGTAAAADATPNFTNSEDPWYNGGQVTVGGGTLLVSASNAVPAQNIAINLANQPLGAFSVQVQGEEISVSRLAFNVSLASEGTNDDVDDITNVTITDANGLIVAGPADGTAADSSNTTGSGDGSIVFNDTVTFPVGTNTYYLKGKIGTDVDNNVVITASTTPSTDFAGTVRGLISGNTITPTPASAVTLNQMTVKAGALDISVSSVPLAQTVIAGSLQFLFTNYILDATNSGEDIRLANFPAEFNAPASDSNITNCKLYDGTNVVSNVQNPTGAASSTSFTFTGGGLTIPKGSAKSLGMKCDVGNGASGTYQWGYDSSSSPSPTGVTSGQSIAATENDAEGQRMTVATGGTLTITLDAGSPGYKIVSSGQTGVELSKFRLSAANEDIYLKQLALLMGGSPVANSASNTPVDLLNRQVTLWEGAQQIGTADFTTGDYATSTPLAYPDGSQVKITRDSSKVITIKGDIAGISNSGPLTSSGDLVSVDYDNNNSISTSINGNYGIGVSSGSKVMISGNPAAPTGKRIFKAYPIFAHVPLTSAEKVLPGGTTANKIFYKFSVKANNGDVALYKFTFNIGSSTLAGTSSLYSLYAYTDSGFSQRDTSFGVGTGLVNGGQCYYNGVSPSAAGVVNPAIYPNTSSTCGSATSTYTISSGATRYFQLEATVASVETGTTNTDQITVRLAGDAAFPTDHQASTACRGVTGTAGDMGSVGANNGRNGGGVSTCLERDTNNNFIWSPISTTTSNTITDFDYTNGFQVEGLPANGMTQESLQSN